MRADPLLGENEWRSRQGNACSENRDAAGLHVGACQTVAVIADGASQGPKGAHLARYWVDAVRSTALSTPLLSPDSLITALRAVHGGLRKKGFLHEIAAYAVLVIDRARGACWALSSGDCRIGVSRDTGEVTWLSPVQTAANPLGEPVDEAHAQNPRRHLLTNRLRVGRFDRPTVTPLEVQNVRQWLLATDGFWLEHLLLKRSVDTLQDDASVLSLTEYAAETKILSNCDNFRRSALAQSEAKPLQPD